MMGATVTFRDSMPSMLPPWLQGDVGGKYVFSIAIMLDANMQRLYEGIRAHMPGVGTATALGYIGQDRLLPRGPYESDAQYAGRLSVTFASYRQAGKPSGVLAAIAPLFEPGYRGTRWVVNAVSQWYWIDASGAETWAMFPSLAVWNFDGASWAWWHTWIVLGVHAPPAGSGTMAWTITPRTVGDGTKVGDAGKTLGGLDSLGSERVAWLQAVIAQWKAKHASVQWIIVAPDASLYQPGGVLPTGKEYGNGSEDAITHIYAPCRQPTCRYIYGADP